MQLKKDIQLLENSSVRLRITLGEEDVQREYDAVVREYCRKVALPGFRRGHVPAEVLVRKFGDTLKAETTEALIEKSLEEVLREIEHKPLPFARPRVQDPPALELGKPFAFEVTYDTHPKVELGAYKGLAIEEPVVEIGDEDVQRELAAIQRQNGVVVDKAEGARAERGDTVTIDYVELDSEGKELERTRREGFTFQLGSGYNLYDLDDDLLGMAKGEERLVEKQYPSDHPRAELAGRTVKLRVRLAALKTVQLPEINDELAQDVSDRYQSLDDLVKDIRARLEQVAGERVRARKIDELMKQIVAGSKIPLPASMVERELALRWREFVRRLGGDETAVLGYLEREGRSVQDLLAEWRPSVEEAIRRHLAIERIAEEEKVEVGDEELEQELRSVAERERRELEELRRQYTEAGLLDALREQRRLAKAYDLLLASAKVRKGAKVRFLDFVRSDG